MIITMMMVMVRRMRLMKMNIMITRMTRMGMELKPGSALTPQPTP